MTFCIRFHPFNKYFLNNGWVLSSVPGKKRAYSVYLALWSPFYLLKITFTLTISLGAAQCKEGRIDNPTPLMRKLRHREITTSGTQFSCDVVRNGGHFYSSSPIGLKTMNVL